MADSGCFTSSVFLALIFTVVTLAEPAVPENGGSAPEVSDSAFGVELELLKSKIAALELSIDERNRELNEKEESIKQMQKIIQDKSHSIASLESEIELLQESLYDKEPLSKSDGQAGELEKQVERLRKDIDLQNKKKDGLGARAYVAGKKIHELNSKLEKLYEVNNEQETRIHKTERLLQVAEEELMKAEVETALISEGRNRVHGEWLPHWLSVHLDYVQDWLPILKEQCLSFVTSLEPRIQLLTAKTVDTYYASKNYIAPRAVKVLKDLCSYTQITIVTRSHLDRVYVALKPYTVKALQACREFMTSSALYHHQVREMLKNNELMRPVANMDLAWFVATALLALPAIFLLKLFSAVFRKRMKKRIQNSNTNHMRRRPKQSHPDK
ncbi:DNA repair ATPase-like protein [Trema orientale]|uniref:DNA repair ATPase-like protein n=1 Tax=Trema orientale TaxID=63057 RepID=A0A2P5EMN0_TREOI|nr:DNA repair ATPase-like protein [Trema orientale]